MSETWQRAVMYGGLVVVAAASYYVAQTSIDAHRASLPVQEYLDCLGKLGSYDWGNVEPHPSASDVCKDLTSRKTVD